MDQLNFQVAQIGQNDYKSQYENLIVVQCKKGMTNGKN